MGLLLQEPRSTQCQHLETNTKMIHKQWQGKTREFNPGRFTLKCLLVSENCHSSAPTRLEAAEAANGISVSTENNYEDVLTSATKKKGKSEGGKKRKGPPKSKDIT